MVFRGLVKIKELVDLEDPSHGVGAIEAGYVQLDGGGGKGLVRGGTEGGLAEAGGSKSGFDGGQFGREGGHFLLEGLLVLLKGLLVLEEEAEGGGDLIGRRGHINESTKL